MAPKLQSKTLETKAQTCPLYEANSHRRQQPSLQGQLCLREWQGSGSGAANTQPRGFRSVRVLLPTYQKTLSLQSQRGARSVGLAVIL